MKKSGFIFALICCLQLFSACQKNAGEGGNSVIKGKVYVKDYNSTQTTLISEYYGADIEVYIIYGTETNYYGDRIRTSYDGSFEFPYLAKGKYRIFAYEKCTGTECPSGMKEVIVNAEITKNKSTVDVGDIVIRD